MNGHAGPRGSSGDEEKAVLLDEERPSSPMDLEHDAGRADIDSRFSNNHLHFPHWTPQLLSQQQQTPPASPTPELSPQQILAALRAPLLRAGIFLLPSFLHDRIPDYIRQYAHPSQQHQHQHHDQEKKQHHHHHHHHPPHPQQHRPKITPTLTPTSYLDGLRGLAAFTVFLCHYLYTAFVIAPGYGFRGAHHDIPKLPFLRLLFSGPPMVCVFFVVSGYALSLRPVRFICGRDWEGLGKGLGSLTVRRGLRLFVPTAVSTLMIVGLVRVGLYEWTREFAGDRRFVRNVAEHHYHRLGSAREQLWDWAGSLFRFVHVWDWAPFGGSTALDVHLWTIPVEFRCSMVLFLTLLGTARLRRGWRMAVVGGLVMFSYLNERWEMVLFYAGMVLAELDVVRGAHGRGASCHGVLPVAAPSSSSPGSSSSSSSPSSSRSSSPSPAPARRFTAKRVFWIAVSIVGLFFMSQPDEGGAETPGWVYLTSLVPKWWTDEHRYWQSVGAILFVLAVGRSPFWKRFFNSDVVQYFGRISYAIYLMHGPVMHTVGYAIERWAWGITGVEDGAYLGGFMLASVFVIPVVIWVSDVFWRAVDAPVVRLAKWLETKCSVSD